MIKVALKDGSIKEFENAISVMDVAKSISEGLARNVVAASVNGEVVGLDHIIDTDCDLISTYISSSYKKTLPRSKACYRTKYRKWILL